MPFLQNARHERFAQLVASGKHSDMEAFKQAGYANESAHQNACRLRANESVAARIEELRARNTEKCSYQGMEAVQYLVEILKTPIAEVTADHRLAQSYDAKSGKIELPNKLGAMQLLAKMCGWQAPEKHELDMDSRRGRNSLKSSLGCEDRERHATISVPDSWRRRLVLSVSHLRLESGLQPDSRPNECQKPFPANKRSGDSDLE